MLPGSGMIPSRRAITPTALQGIPLILPLPSPMVSAGSVADHAD